MTCQPFVHLDPKSVNTCLASGELNALRGEAGLSCDYGWLPGEASRQPPSRQP